MNKATLKPYGKFAPNKASGKFLIVLPPGEYELAIKADGYEKYSETIKVFDRSANTEINRDFVLTPAITKGKKKLTQN